MKKLLIIVVLLVIAGCCSGCSPGYQDVAAKYPLKPKELMDCQFFKLVNDNGSPITVVRCPNSTTSVTEQQGKTTTTTVVIDGVEYVRK